MEKGMKIVSVLAVAVLMFASMAVMLAPASMAEENEDDDQINFTVNATTWNTSAVINAKCDIDLVYFTGTPASGYYHGFLDDTDVPGCQFNQYSGQNLYYFDGYPSQIGTYTLHMARQAVGSSSVEKGSTLTLNVVDETYTITISSGTGGSVSKSSVTNVPYNTSVGVSGSTLNINGTTVTATPSSGYTFNKWTDSDGDDVTDGYKIRGNETFTAKFTKIEPTTYTVSFTTDGHGSVSRSSISSVPSGSSISVSGNTVTINGTTVTATPDSGYKFDRWENTSGNVTSNRTITAHFTPITYTVTFADDGNGFVSPSQYTGISNGASIEVSNNSVTIGGSKIATAYGNSGYVFDHWENTSGTITSDRTITAYFRAVAPTTYTVSFTTDGHGSVSQTEITGVSSGTSIDAFEDRVAIGSEIVTATAAEGYEFDYWENASGTVTSNRTITAHFKEITGVTYTVSFNTDVHGSVDHDSLTEIPDGAEITVSGNTVTINGTTVTATAAEGYEFDRWENTSGTITSDRTITAYFRAVVPTYTVSFNTDGHGSVEPGSITVPEGSPITVNGNTVTIDGKDVSATTSLGYKFKEWTINGQPIAAGTTITSDVTITATFEVIPEDECTITFKAEKGGSVDQTQITVKKGSSFTVSGSNVTIDGKTVKSTADKGYTFDKWSVSTGDKANEDMTVTAYFKADTPGPDPPTPPEPEKKEPIYLYGFIGFTVGTVALIGAALFGVRHPIIYIVAAVFAIVATVLALMYFGVIKL